MKAFVPAMLVIALVLPGVASAAGLAFTKEISVIAPDQELADAVLARAEQCCREIGRSWLGEERSPLGAPIAIHVQISETEDWGFTLPIDNPRRSLHRVWLKTSRSRALGSTLGHEMVHAFFAARFRERLPAWAEEAIASTYDDPERVAVCQRAVARLAQSGKWPELETVFNGSSLSPTDETGYGVAGSVGQYLLHRGGKGTLVKFAQAGKTQGWGRALRQAYGFNSVGELQQAWQSWAVRASSGADLTSLRTTAH